MFDIGWTELLVIGVVALIVVGPKDLPGMFRTLGRFTGKAKGMARDFQSAMNAAADEAGVKDVADDLKNMTSKKNLGLDAMDDVASKFEEWNPMASSKGTEAKAVKKVKKAAAVKEGGAAATKAHKNKAAKAGKKVATKKTAAKLAAKKPSAKKPVTKKAAAKPATKPATKPKAATKPKTGKEKTGSKS